MHIPDGFLSAAVSVSTYVISGTAIAVGVGSKLKNKLELDKVPILGVMAAFIFAAQMVNFPIIGGTSGHLIGAVLAAVLFGPWTASIIMTTILAIQCLLFADGGITALGANILNMGIIAVFAGYYIFKLINRGKSSVSPAALFISAWVSVVLSSVLASFELFLSVINNVTFIEIIKLMIYWHMLIGLGEGLITVLIVKYLMKVKPDILNFKRV